MLVEMCAVDKIIPYARNPRKNDRAIPMVKASIKEFGFQQPIVVDKEYVIVVGHTRYEAAKQLGYPEVPVTIAKNLTPQQIKAYRIADNKTADFSSFDNDLLILEIQELQDANYEIENTAFSAGELEDLLLEISQGKTNPYNEWIGMPEYDQNHSTTEHHIIVNFKNMDDLNDFAILVDQKITPKTQSIWFPIKTDTTDPKDIEFQDE